MKHNQWPTPKPIGIGIGSKARFVPYYLRRASSAILSATSAEVNGREHVIAGKSAEMRLKWAVETTPAERWPLGNGIVDETHQIRN